MANKQEKMLGRIKENASIGRKRIDSLLESKDAAERQLGRDLKAFFDQIWQDADDALIPEYKNA